jgi:hypothetical protein
MMITILYSYILFIIVYGAFVLGSNHSFTEHWFDKLPYQECPSVYVYDLGIFLIIVTHINTIILIIMSIT